MASSNEKLELLTQCAASQNIKQLSWNGKVSTLDKSNKITYLCPSCDNRTVSIYWGEFFYSRKKIFPSCLFCRARAGTSSSEKFLWLKTVSEGIEFSYTGDTINNTTRISFICPDCGASVIKTYAALRASKTKFRCESCAKSISSSSLESLKRRSLSYKEKNVRAKIRSSRAMTVEETVSTLPPVYSRGLVGFKYVPNGIRPDGHTRYRQDYLFRCECCSDVFTRAKSTVQHEIKSPWQLKHCYCSVCSNKLGGYYSGFGDPKEEVHLRKKMRLSLYSRFERLGISKDIVDIGLHSGWVIHHIVPVGLVYLKGLDKNLISEYTKNGILLPTEVHSSLHKVQREVLGYEELRFYFRNPYLEYPASLVRAQELLFLKALRSSLKDYDYESVFDTWMLELGE